MLNQLTTDSRNGKQLPVESHYKTSNLSSTALDDQYQISNNRKYECSVCYQTFQRKVSLDVHRLTHGNISVSGNDNGKASLLRNEAERSNAKVNNDNFISASSSVHKVKLAHESVSKNKKQKNICQVCNKFCFSLSNLINHARTHTNEQPFPCPQCNRAFNLKSNLTRHMRNFKHGIGEQLYNLLYWRAFQTDLYNTIFYSNLSILLIFFMLTQRKQAIQ